MSHKNIFGEGDLHTIEHLDGSIYIQCAACMSLYAEALSWANANPERIAKSPEHADNIVTLSCQVTDLAVFNDLRNVKRLREDYPDAQHWVAGCLAHRFDIELPYPVGRLDHFRVDYQHLDDTSLVDYIPPFWVEDFKEGPLDKQVDGDGYRMRSDYPLRIGAGCSQQCTYCTIRVTRGQPYFLEDRMRLLEEFDAHEDVVLISDNPMPEQIKFWCNAAMNANKDISIRNVEPQNALKAWEWLRLAANADVLRELHVPIQSLTPAILREMKRPVDATLHFVVRAQLLRDLTHLSTNIIIDRQNPLYSKDDEIIVRQLFDTVSWNPMWDGKWDPAKAHDMFYDMFPWHQED